MNCPLCGHNDLDLFGAARVCVSVNPSPFKDNRSILYFLNDDYTIRCYGCDKSVTEYFTVDLINRKIVPKEISVNYENIPEPVIT